MASAALPPPRGRPLGGPVTTEFFDTGNGGDAPADPDPPAEDDGGNRFT